MLLTPSPTTAPTPVSSADVGETRGQGRWTGQWGHPSKVSLQQVTELGCFILIKFAWGSGWCLPL